MAADFMERPARLRNSFWLLALIFAGCHHTAKKEEIKQPAVMLVNHADTAIGNSNGTILFHANPFTGTLFTLYEGTKDTAELSSYLNGKEHGEWKQFYSSGHVKEKRNFNNGRKTGDYTAWWENGNKKMHYQFVNDEYEGECNEWNISGRLVKIMNYRAGHEEGAQKWWYDNGKIKANYIIKEGRRFGLLGTKNCINVSDSIFKD